MPEPDFKNRLYLTICFLLLGIQLFAQDSTLFYNAEVLASGATNQTPFWLYANQGGAVPTQGSFGLIDAGVYKIYNPNNPRFFQWSGGIEGVVSYAQQPKAILMDAFLAAKLGVFEILAGQQRTVTGLMDTTYSSGSLSVSGNARPVPGIRLSIPQFYPISFTGNIVAFKLSYSDGYLGKSEINYGSARYIPDTYLHQKSLYLRFGDISHKLKIYAGMNHQAIWGGENKIAPLYNLPMDKAYWYVLSGKTLDYRKIGFHFGTIDFGAEWRGRDWSYFLYRQNIYETGSLFRVTNFHDGLNGLAIKRINPLPTGSSYFAFQTFLIEVLGTQNQVNSHPLSGLAIFENGNYYNSYVYRRGWSYFGNGIGNPLLSPARNTNESLPRNYAEFTNNNRLLGFHFATTATFAHIKFGLKTTYSRNLGTYISRFEQLRQQASMSISAEKALNKIRGCQVFANAAADLGDLYPNTYGLMVGIRKKGFLD